MRIGKNELRILKLLAGKENGEYVRGLRYLFDVDADSQNYERKAFSRAVNSLAEKGLIAKYVLVVEGPLGWSEDGFTKVTWGKDRRCHAIKFKKEEDLLSKPRGTPPIQIRIGLTERGKEELNERAETE